MVPVPPKDPVIYDMNKGPVQRVAGPYNEGERLLLSCQVEGGKPLPSVTWWRDSTVIDDTFKLSPEGIVKNDLEIRDLKRTDLMSILTCQASNTNMSSPASTSVAVDMNLPPLEVVIENKSRHLSAGKPVEIVCRAYGSRPEATITWWRGDSKIKRTREKMSSEGNVTSSLLTFIPSIDDSNRHITCKAENKLVAGQYVEDGWMLNVNYAPRLILRLGSKLRHSHIQEGNDVYFECDIKASPWVTDISWKFEGKELHTNTTAGVIVSNQSLVLQKVQRSNRGRYTCSASNAEGYGESVPFYLRVQYTPICKSEQKVLYGVAKHEPVQVTCEVESDPMEVEFQWRFNNSAELLEGVIFNTNQNRSVATYIPRSEYDYGSLLCWGTNSVGPQREPCVFAIIPAGQPDALQNCSVSNYTEDSFVIKCAEGYDGGMLQYFVLELYISGHDQIRYNITSDTPVFSCKGLTPGTRYRMAIFAVNNKGRSRPVIFRASTLSTPESLTQRGKDDDWQANFSPILIVLVSVISGLVLVALIIVLLMKARTKGALRKGVKKRNEKSATPIHNESDDRRELTIALPESDAKCPDIIQDSNIAAEIPFNESEKQIFQKEILLRTESPCLVNPISSGPSSEYQLNTWDSNSRAVFRQIPSPIGGASLRYSPTMDSIPEYKPPTQRAEWTLPRPMPSSKLKNRQTDV